MPSGREVELIALGSSDSAIMWPIMFMIGGVIVLALIGHFAFRRESQIRAPMDFEIENSFELFEGLEDLFGPDWMDPDSAAAHPGAAGPELVQ